MFNLSVFAYILVFLILIAFILVCIKKKKMSPEVICTAIITLSITAGVGMLTFDYVNGAEVIVTSIDIDEWNATKKFPLFMKFSDKQENSYWGIGSISTLERGADVSVRITYLPKTKFVLGVERYVGDIPVIHVPGIVTEHKDYRSIYSNGDALSIACIFSLFIICLVACQKKE